MRLLYPSQLCVSVNVCTQTSPEIPEVACTKRTIMVFFCTRRLWYGLSAWGEFMLAYFRSLHICKSYHINAKYIINDFIVYITRLFYTYIWLISKSAVAMEINWYNLYKNSIVFYLKVWFFVFCKFVVVCVAWYTDHLGMLQGSVRHVS